MRFGLFRRSSAPVARERLQILLEFERRIDGSDLLGRLRDEIIAVISKHVDINRAGVEINLSQTARENRLVANIPLVTAPSGGRKRRR